MLADFSPARPRWFSRRIRLLAHLVLLGLAASEPALTLAAARPGRVEPTGVAVAFPEAGGPASATGASPDARERGAVLIAQRGVLSPNGVPRTKPASDLRTVPPAGFGFSFGPSSSTAITRSWPADEVVTVLDPTRTQRVRTYTKPGGGLRFQVDAVEFADYPAREWKLWFENPPVAGGPAVQRDRGPGNSPTTVTVSLNGDQVGPTMPLSSTDILSNLWAGEITLGRDARGEFRLHYADGSSAVITDFQPRTATLLPNSTLNLAPVGGRSSDGVMPFFNIAKPGGGGLIVAVGWTGQWRASFVRDAGTNLTVQIGMEDFNLRLYPGERIRTPAVLTLTYEGDWLDGQRQLRRLLLDHYSPRPNGRPVNLPIAASGATIGFNNVTVTNQIHAIRNIFEKQLPVDTYWIDAGWEIGGFAWGQGNNIPDPARFPNGLAPVSREAHSCGLRFLVWFEPERVMPNTWVRTNHPEWLLTPSGLPREYAYQQNDGWRMLNLGNPAALNWAKTNFSAIITNWGIDIYRHDFNMHPLWYWRTGEAADRRGMNEIRYVMGLYEYFDTLQRHHPGLLMDNCASGGRRLDFEMGRRLVPLLRSDYLWEVVGAQAMTYALAHWLPLIGQGGVSTANNDFRSGMGSWGAYAFDYYTPGAAFWGPLMEQLANLATLNHLFSGDFYPLTPYSTHSTDWIAWQFHRGDLNEGIVQAFRRASNLTPSLRLRLQGLESSATYQIIEFEQATTNTATGRQLMSEGFTVRVATAPEAATVKYRRIAP